MNEGELQKLYARVLALAQDIPLCERLEAPDATVTMVSPLCGSQITVDVSVEDDRISAFGQKVRACTLGAAAASILASRVVGRSPAEMRELRDVMHRMLKEGGPAPAGDWSQLAMLEPARDLISRHGSIMLSFDALAEALDEIDGDGAPAQPRPRTKGIPDTVRA